MTDMDFLRSMNDDLQALQAKLEADLSGDEGTCNIFILGLPRSGTSLLCQTIFSSMSVACTNNLMARFWNAPLVGAQLSRIVLGDKRETDFSSRFGTTSLPWEPHEFSWFWHNLLCLHFDDSGLGIADSDAIDWQQVKKALCQLSGILGLPLVHKPLEMVAQFLGEFVQLFDKAIFVYIDRDAMDVASSLANVRRDRNNNLAEWWGSYPSPTEYCRLEAEPFNVQIAGQVSYLKAMYDRQLPLVPENRLVKTDYNTLCLDPASVLQEIQALSIGLGSEIQLLQEPEPVGLRTKREDQSLSQALKAGFDKIEGWASAG